MLEAFGACLAGRGDGTSGVCLRSGTASTCCAADCMPSEMRV